MAQAGDGTPLVYCNNPNSKMEFQVADYRQLQDAVAELIGMKQLIRNPYELSRLLQNLPELSHFIDESVFAQGIAAGASGMYAWLAAINPRLSVEWYEACVRGDWDRAMEIQTMVNRFRYTTIETWGYQHPATIHKLNARLNPNIGCPLRSGHRTRAEPRRISGGRGSGYHRRCPSCSICNDSPQGIVSSVVFSVVGSGVQ
jgi:dihydrodipicolinate synthase/N-acetylneuraminate lyase